MRWRSPVDENGSSAPALTAKCGARASATSIVWTSGSVVAISARFVAALSSEVAIAAGCGAIRTTFPLGMAWGQADENREVAHARADSGWIEVVEGSIVP